MITDLEFQITKVIEEHNDCSIKVSEKCCSS